jgi:hypothetical protein
VWGGGALITSILLGAGVHLLGAEITCVHACRHRRVPPSGPAIVALRHPATR